MIYSSLKKNVLLYFWTLPLLLINLKTIFKAQLNDLYFCQMQQQNPEQLHFVFDNKGEKIGPDLAITINNPITNIWQILMPQSLHNKLLEYYHTVLIHPGATRLFKTFCQHYVCPNMEQQVKDYCKTCPVFQKAKHGIKGYLKVPLKDIEASQPWKDVCLDLLGLWKAEVKQ